MEQQATVSVLGPLRVRLGATDIPLTQQRSRQIVALLARREGQVCTWHELAEQLWPHDPPAEPRQTIQVTVSRLRSALGAAAGLIETVNDGYRLADAAIDAAIDNAVDATVDATIYRHAVEAASGPGPTGDRDRANADAAAVHRLERASALWRGSPLADVELTPLLDGWVAELLDLRAAGDRALAAVYIRAGRLDDAIGLARRLVAADASDEDAAGTLASALARRGKRSEAIRVIDALRTNLRDSGITVSDEVARMERSILAGRVELAPVASVSSATSGVRFVAREREHERLTDDERSSLMVVSGVSGIGKSGLLRTCVATLADRGVTSIVCQVAPTATAPLEPVRAIVTEMAGRGLVPDAPLVAWASGHRARSPAPTSSRDQLIEMLSDVIDSGLSKDGLHLFVDDGQWLDRTSEAVLRRVAEMDRAPLTVFTRPSLDGSSEWADLAGSLHTIELGPFDAASTLAFLHANHPRLADPDTAAALRRRSGGNLLLLTLLAQGIEEGTVVDGELPVTLLMAAADRLSALPGPVRRTLEVAAVVGDEFDISTVTALEPGALAHLIAAAGAGLVVLHGASGTFSHGVIAEAARQLLSPVRRLDLHDMIGSLLHDAGAPATSYAHHFDQSAALDPLRATAAQVAAGREYVASHDREGALARFERAWALLSGVDDAPLELRAEVLLAVGATERRLGRPEHVAHLTEAATTARAIDEHDLFFDAVIELCEHGASTAAGHVDQSVLALLRDALELAPPPHMKARLCAAAATLLSFSEGTTHGRSLFRTAWRTATLVGDDDLEAAVLAHTHLGLSDPDDVDERQVAIDRLRDLSGDDVNRRWEVAFLTFTQSMLVGDRERLHGSIESMRELCALPQDRPRDFGMAFCESAWATVTGDFALAEDRANQALAIGTARFSTSWALGTYAMLRLSMHDARGDQAAFLPTVEGAVQQFPKSKTLRAALALSALQTGDKLRALSELRSMLAKGVGSVDRDLAWSGTMCMAARVAAAVADDEMLIAIDQALAPWSTRFGFCAVASVGPVDDALARVALARGDVVRARRHCSLAFTALERAGADAYAPRLAELESLIGGT